MLNRIYKSILEEILLKQNVMLFLSGPRQVGKTTLTKMISEGKAVYFNWDVDKDRKRILSGQDFIEDIFPMEMIGKKPILIFDEIHKFSNWKNYLKGFFDVYNDRFCIIVTGSAHLNIYQKGGDSLMGRYLPFTIHPFSVGEMSKLPLNHMFRSPSNILEYDDLYLYGGFPFPLIQKNMQSYRQWLRTRKHQLFRQDVRDIFNIQEVAQLETLSTLLVYQSGNILNRSTYANKLQVSNPTISRWLEVFKQLYYAFTIQPWSTNIPHSLLKEPKVYMVDWSLVEDPGARFENFVASHLRKSVDFWNECGYGEFELYFLRDKSQREVDFLISKNGSPWMLIEVKTSLQPVTKSLHYFKEITKAPFAFQVTKDMEYVEWDCFSQEGTFIVPAKTFLSQLV
jgi:predicted AAA+ superfamily ATPase